MHILQAKTILSAANGINPYRGCTHGCIYCDSRSVCYQMNHAFEDIAVKENAPALLEEALRRKRKPCMIGTGSMCDPYMPCEETLGITRSCLRVIDRYGFGVTVLTKSARILRDLPLIEHINRTSKAVVQITLTTFDETLCRILEPHASSTRERFRVLTECRDRGIPTVVWLCPILPYLNDTEENLRGILSYCFEAGVYGIVCFGFGVTLRTGSREYFYRKLDEHFPGMKARYLRQFGGAYECLSENDAQLRRILTEECRAHGVLCDQDAVFSYLKTFPEDCTQPSLFDL